MKKYRVDRKLNSSDEHKLKNCVGRMLTAGANITLAKRAEMY